MADVVLFHHAQGLTPGVQAFADRLRAAGHLVIVPDYYRGLTFDTIEAGVAHAQAVGFAAMVDRAIAAAEPLPGAVVVAGFSFGTLPAQRLAQTHRGVIGAILYHGGLPTATFGTAWPAAVALQVHVVENDAWHDIDDTEVLIAESGGQLLVYPGTGHLVTDRGHPDYDAEVAEEILVQTLHFLDRL
jgi:dienelactone hydrolase